MSVEFVTSVGRIVWGNPARSMIKKDQNTKQPIMRDGKQVEQWACGIAFPKAEFQQYIMPYLQQAASEVFPHGVPANFSWKIKDGDGVDSKGRPYNEREGYAGHYVLAMSTEAFSPPVYKNENGVYRQLSANEIKTGDYVVVKLNVVGNQPKHANYTPGIYVNPMAFDHVGYGKEIVTSSIDPEEAFGGRTYQLPPGASNTPLASNSTAPYNTQPFVPPAYNAPANTPTVASSPKPAYNAPANNVSPKPLPAPAHDFVNNAGSTPPPAVIPGIPPGRY